MTEVAAAPHLKGPSYRVAPEPNSIFAILRELWQYRLVIWILVLRETKVRYKQTYLGIAWYVLQPLGYMLVFTFVFSYVFARGAQSLPYSLFALSGITIWIFFSRTIMLGAASFQSYQGMLDKVYFPRLAVPICFALSAFIDLMVSGLLLGVMMVVLQVAMGWKALLVPVFLLGTMLFAVAMAIFFASLDVRYRDVRHALTFITQLWMFATPIMYPIDIIPPRFHDIYALNPLVGLLQGFRWALFADTPPPDPNHLVIAGLATLVMLWLAIVLFRRAEGTLVDTL